MTTLYDRARIITNMACQYLGRHRWVEIHVTTCKHISNERMK